MGKKKNKVYVVGHKNPDTDSICSAIAYAELKNKICEEKYVPRRAGQINEETYYILNKFGVKEPEFIKDVKLQVKDIDIRKMEGVDPGISIKDVWDKMKREKIKTVPIIEEDELVGVISTGDIATSYMDVADATSLSDAKTSYRNIVHTLQGRMVTGPEHGHFTRGKVTIAASDAATLKEIIAQDDLVILGNRYDNQACAMDIDAGCLIICNGNPISEELIQKAEEQSTVIISTPMDIYTAVRLINQSIPVKYFMSRGPLVTFKLTDYVDDIKDIMTKYKFRDFPILDRHGRFRGFISRRRFLNSKKKQVILVDHNEKSQAVDGIEEAEIIEIIDHHRIGSIETMGPVYFRNQPVGCTATIVTQMYEEAGVKIPTKIAGILCAAIISDTLLFRSPTCTAIDVATAERLSAIAKIDMEELSKEMFRAGSNLQGKSAQDLLFQDFKQFTVGQEVFGVGQINSMSGEELEEIKAMLVEYLPKGLAESGMQKIYFMLTNILTESTEIICAGVGAKQNIINAFDLENNASELILKGVVSRKKQVIPTLVASLQQ